MEVTVDGENKIVGAGTRTQTHTVQAETNENGSE
jgi:hypothetical protein